MPPVNAADPQPRRAGSVTAPEIVETIPNIDHRFGDGRAEVLGLGVFDEQGRACAHSTGTFKYVKRLPAGPDGANPPSVISTD